MSIKYENAKKQLTSLLHFYFKNDIPLWDSDNSSEIECMVSEIEDMIDEKIKEALTAKEVGE